jgi:hypothetical protein
MNFVTGLAPFRSHRRVFIGEWPAQIRMAREAAWFVCCERPNLLQQKAAMRIVAIRARHCRLRKPVCVRPLKRSPYTRMTRSALLIDVPRLSGDQTRRFRLVHSVAAGTSDTASGMAALDSSHMCRLIAMASETGFVHPRGGQLRRIDDFLR